jgi:hypothetical protein
MKVYCLLCGAADLADTQYELIRRGSKCLDPDDLESAGLCFECARMTTAEEWERLCTEHDRKE